MPTSDVEAIKRKLAAKDIGFVAQREVPGQEGQIVVYFSTKTVTNVSFLIELKFRAGYNACKVTIKSTSKGMSEICKASVVKLIS
jgi:hypothetical protein